MAHNGQGLKQLGCAIPSPRANRRWTKDTKADDILYRPAELGRAGTDAWIFAAAKRRVGSPPNCWKPVLAVAFQRFELLKVR